MSKKQEAVTIFNKTENRLPTIRPFLNGDEGKNYGFDDCMAYLMECLNEDARLDYWIFTGISGDGYTMVYNRNHSNYCEYCIAGYTSGQELVSRVFNAIGYDYTYVDDKEINLKKSEYIKKLISYIDKGIPVLARTTLAATPADVDVRTYLTYVGYEDDGKTLLFKSDYDNLFCYDTSSTIKQDWIFPGEKIREVPFEKIVSNAVADLPRLMTLPEKDGQFFGSQAFRAWADDIEKGRYGEKSDLWSDYGVYVCNLATNCMANNSTHAPSVVNLLAQFSPQYSEMRTKIANLYFHMGHGDGVGGAWRKLEDLEAGFNVKAETFQDKERCRKIVAVLRECADDMDEIVQTLQEAL